MCMSTLYRVRKKALIEIHGGHDVSYNHLPMYCEVIHSTNPGQLLIVHGILQHMVVWKGCLLVVGASLGAHLKGNYRGVLLLAIALDGNNEIFPVAWGIVAGEDEEAWNSFIWHLREHWNLQEGQLLPKCDRRICCKHLSKNWKRKFAGPLMLSLFWRACGAHSAFTFRKAMETLKKVNPLAVEWLVDLGEQSAWTIHKFNPTVTSAINKSNFVESFNATLGIERCRPVLTLLECK
ncbi:hypothetical protein RDABS01_020292 [Bienertia sinuspersici]